MLSKILDSWLASFSYFGLYLLSRARWMSGRIRQQQAAIAVGFHRPSNDPVQVLRTVKNFVRKYVPVILGLEPGTEVRLEMPARGRDTMVLILTAGDRKAVLRTFPIQRIRKAEGHVLASELLLKNGVNVPQILYSSLKTAKFNAIFLLEEFIEGESLNPQKLTQDNVRAIARQLARMHAIQNTRWGSFQAEHSEDFFRSLIRRISRELATLEKQEIISSGEREEARSWFNSFRVHLQGNAFSLTQKDLHPGNAIFSSLNGNYYIIDPNRLQWKPAADEVVRAYRRLLRDDKEKIAIFNETYTSEAWPKVLASVVQLIPFYKAEHQLSIASDTAGKRASSADENAMRVINEAVAELQTLIRSASPQSL